MQKKTILLAQFKHETNPFNPSRTTLRDFQNRALNIGEDMIIRNRGNHSEPGAFIDVLEARPDVRMLPVVDGNACPSGLVTADAFEYVASMLENAVRTQKPDAILLALHGAMITEDDGDADGALLERLRAAAGPGIPIVATLDFHANLTDRMVRCSTALFPQRYYPHTDFYDRGVEAAQLVLDVLDGRRKPTAARQHIPLIYPHLPTDGHPCGTLTDMLIEASGERHAVYFVAGFSRADVSCAGASIYALTDDDPEGAKALCSRFAQWVSDHLEDFSEHHPDPVQAVAEAIASSETTVFADGADNPGSGSAGDATELLHELLRQGATGVAVASIWDPETVQQAHEAGVGETIRVRLGGKSSPIVGAPIEREAYVRLLGDGEFTVRGPVHGGVAQHMGKTAVLKIEGLTIIVSSLRVQTFDLEMFRAHGIEPTAQKILVVKSVVHFKAAFSQAFSRLVVLDMPNVCPLNERVIPFTRVPRPIYPLDDADACRAYAKTVCPYAPADV